MTIKKMLAGVSAIAIVAISSMTSAITTSAVESCQAYLCFTNGVSEQWDAGVLGSAITITGDGQYSVSVDNVQPAESILLMLIQTDLNIYEEDGNATKLNDNFKISVDSVNVNGTDISYSNSGNGSSTDDAGINYRFNIFNTWGGNNVKDIPGDSTVNEGTIIVNFTVSGSNFGESAPTTEATTTAATTTDSENGGSVTTTTAADGSTTTDATTTEATTTAKAGSTTTAKAGSTTKATTTTKADGTTTTAKADEDTNPATGSAGIVGVSIAGLIAAGCATVVVKKK